MTDQKYRNRVKESFGIICVKKIDGVYHAAIVKKRYSYAFNEFVQGKYYIDKTCSNGFSIGKCHIQQLLNNMTNEEKLDILSMDFDRIWYRVWLRKHKITDGNQANKFENDFLADDGKRIRRLLAGSTTRMNDVWEIPKGKKISEKEAELTCALREFTEETGINSRKIHIIPNRRLYLEFDDNNIHYKMTYFIAVADSDAEIAINFSNIDAICEIDRAMWITPASAGILGLPVKYINVIKTGINIVKKFNKLAD